MEYLAQGILPTDKTLARQLEKLVAWYFLSIKLTFSADRNLRRESIPNMSNLIEGFYHRSYALWKKDLNGLSFNP